MPRCLMLPQPDPRKPGTDGIARVIEAYYRHLPSFGIDLVNRDVIDYDLISVHAGLIADACDVAHCHGLYWTADHDSNLWQLQVNARVIDSIRQARQVTVPSAWVAESFQRDMRFTPHIVPHGIDWADWQTKAPMGNYVLYNKNREGDVCSSLPVIEMARRFPNGKFLTTFLPKNSAKYSNVEVTGTVPHVEMKKLVQSAAIYLSTTKETFGIGVLEAMASGVPVLGFAYGGNVDLVEHGVNGYLARPGDYDDLAEGLDYCLRYRDTLGNNGREMAKVWTWEKACEKVAKVYEMALDQDPATVAIVIPFYNKTEEQLGRAVESAVGQTYEKVVSIIIVDDGSEDPKVAEAVVQAYRGSDNRVRLVREGNSGVARARNRGIEDARGAKFVSCLDADDAIEPEFIAECVRELEADRSLGIAYTKLYAIRADGSGGMSDWPGEFNYDRQLMKGNQIPTCCVFRREMWERLGGYNPKWHGPAGAGAEDAEFWLRAGAHGWGAKMASRRPLFVYSLGTGVVSGDSGYVEPDWTAVWPWAGKDGDKQHPFASVATPKNFSHQVRQYDEPIVSVVIPVGPGHEESVRNALDSLEHQSMRKWEAIVVWDAPSKIAPSSPRDVPWQNNKVDFTYEESLERLWTAYPYVRWVVDFNPNQGPGYSRNRGVEIARAPFLVFLDADDWLYPNCLERMLEEWNEHQSIIYTDYIGKTFIDNPADLDPVLQERMYYYDEVNKEAVIGHKAAEYECEVAQQQPLVDSRGNIYVWTNVTSLIPTAWHNEVGGFDEKMPSWEDIDYHWRLARAGKCYYRIPEELMVYQMHTGHRREVGRQEYPNLLQYMETKYEEVEKMPCSGCGGKRSNPAPRNAPARQSPLDSEMVLCSYTHRNEGSHGVIGAAQFQFPPPDVPTRRIGGTYRLDYGYRKGGGKEEFYVHKQDIALSPDLFKPIEERIAVAIPREERVAQAAPERIVTDDAPPDTISMPEMVQQMAAPESHQPPVLAKTAPPEPLQPPPIDLASYGGPSDTPEMPSTPPEPVAIPQRPFDLQTLPGIGPASAELLRGDGINTKEDVLGLGVKGLAAYRGIGEIKAEMIIESIRELG